jgi:hypothetical protein
MSSDPLEKNVGDLIRRGALPLDKQRSSRARERFLDAAAARPERASWKIAAAAAAALVSVTIVWSARLPQRPTVPTPIDERPVETAALLGHGGDKNLQGQLRRRDGGLRFEAKSPLPDGLRFKIRAERLEIQSQEKELLLDVRSSLPGSATLIGGAFDFDWPDKGPGKVRLLVSALDDLQDVSLVKRMRELRIPEAERQWTFEYCAWDEKLLVLLGPQLVEVTTLADQVRDLITRVGDACVTEAAFESLRKGLIKEAEKLQAKAEGMAATGLFPESSRRVGFTARDLAQSMAIFKWEDGKFLGPRSYYTNGEKAKTHRNDPFELATLRGYLTEAAVVAGREFSLWILAEFGRSGPRPGLAETVRPHERRPGLVDVAERLQKLVHEFHGVDLQRLGGDAKRIP